MGQPKRIACFDIKKKEWLIYESGKEANLIMGLRGSAVGVAKLQRAIVKDRYFFCDPEDMGLYPEDIILDLDKRRAVKERKGTCKKPIMVYDIRKSNLGWVEYPGLKETAKILDVPLSSLNSYIRSQDLHNKRYIYAYKGEENTVDIQRALELPLEDDRYYIWPTSLNEREELFKRLQMGKYHPVYNTLDKLKELAAWANEQVEENNLAMMNKIEAAMMKRYGTKSSIVAARMKEKIEGMDMDDFDDEPLGEED